VYKYVVVSAIIEARFMLIS